MTRLLSQREIHQRQSVEQKQHIDGALKIARKIDELRKKKSKEEHDLYKFQEQTKKIVQEEIDSLIQQKKSLEYENKILERNNDVLNKPFEGEWERLRNKKIRELDTAYDEINEKQAEVYSLLVEQKEKTHEATLNQERAQEKLAEAKKVREKASKMEEKARTMLQDIFTSQLATEDDLARKKKELEKREFEIDNLQAEITMRERALSRASEELAQREIFVNDKYETLKRAQAFIRSKVQNQPK